MKERKSAIRGLYEKKRGLMLSTGNKVAKNKKRSDTHRRKIWP